MAQTKSTKRRTPVRHTTIEPSHDAIAQRAFELYLARGAEHGRADEDWARAEQELRATG